MPGQHKGVKPAGQPRSLRSIAESKSAPDKYDSDIEYDGQAGIPMSAHGAGQRYKDAAEEARPLASAAVRKKRPFDSNCDLSNPKSGR
jgi:hypothetical protein